MIIIGLYQRHNWRNAKNRRCTAIRYNCIQGSYIRGNCSNSYALKNTSYLYGSSACFLLCSWGNFWMNCQNLTFRCATHVRKWDEEICWTYGPPYLIYGNRPVPKCSKYLKYRKSNLELGCLYEYLQWKLRWAPVGLWDPSAAHIESAIRWLSWWISGPNLNHTGSDPSDHPVLWSTWHRMST